MKPPSPHAAPLAPVLLALLALLAFAALSAPCLAEWPQFRGERASGLDASRPLPTAWGLEGDSRLRWKTPIRGLGHASPIAWGDRVYLATAVRPGESQLKVGLYGDIESVDEPQPHEWRLLALDASSGSPVWDVTANSAVPRVKRHPKASHCNSTPATDGERIVAILGSEGLFCFDRDGREAWRRDLGPMDAGFFSVPSAQWGFASSPVIHQGRVLVLCDVQTNSFLAAFDLRDGRELWRTARRDVPTWGTPAIVEHEGRVQVVVNGWHHTGGYEFADGRERWRLDGGGDIPVPTPISGLGLIFQTSAHGRFRPLRAIRIQATGDITPLDPGATNRAVAWAHGRQGAYMQTPILVGDLLWSCFDNGVLTCVDARTGAIRYSERLPPGQGYTASPVSDGRHLYFASETGQVYVVPATPAFGIVSTNQLGSACLASPAIHRGMLLFRTRDHLLAIADPKPQP